MMARPARSAEWPATVRLRDGRLVAFDLSRIEIAVARAAREAGHRDPEVPDKVARLVADALARRPRGGVPAVEEIQDVVEAQLVAAGLDDVARAYIIYRQHRAEVRTAKALIGVRDELKLSVAAATVLAERYLLRDDHGRPAESTGEMMDRVANTVAAAEESFRRGSSAMWAEQFSGAATPPRVLTELTDADERGHRTGPALRVFRSASRRFAALDLRHPRAQRGNSPGRGRHRLHVHSLAARGDRVARTGGTASGPMSFLRLFDPAAGASSRWAAADVVPPWPCWTYRTPTSMTSSPPRPIR
jgi:ribonucleoside-diphosphate reductase alpha chain